MTTPPLHPIEDRISNQIRFERIFLTVLGAALLAFVVLSFTTESSPTEPKYEESIVVILNTENGSKKQKCFNGAATTTMKNFIRVWDIPGDSLYSLTFPKRRIHEVIHKEHPCK